MFLNEKMDFFTIFECTFTENHVYQNSQSLLFKHLILVDSLECLDCFSAKVCLAEIFNLSVVYIVTQPFVFYKSFNVHERTYLLY